MHLSRVTFFPEKYPTRDFYPFNQEIFHRTGSLQFDKPVTFFAGENGTGKTTLLEALAWRSYIHIWRGEERQRYDHNPYQELLYRYIYVEWTNGVVAGSYFSSQIFRHFAQNLDEWAASDPEMLGYFGGKSLMSQSHGESLMSYFSTRYRIKGLYLLDEPETALSPRSQLGFLRLLREISVEGAAQFIIASHSPILLACPEATIYSFNGKAVEKIDYEETEHYQIYRAFMEDRERYLTDD